MVLLSKAPEQIIDVNIDGNVLDQSIYTIHKESSDTSTIVSDALDYIEALSNNVDRTIQLPDTGVTTTANVHTTNSFNEVSIKSVQTGNFFKIVGFIFMSVLPFCVIVLCVRSIK